MSSPKFLKVIRATINSQPHEFGAGVSMLEAAASAGIDIPTLCRDPRLWFDCNFQDSIGPSSEQLICVGNFFQRKSMCKQRS